MKTIRKSYAFSNASKFFTRLSQGEQNLGNGYVPDDGFLWLNEGERKKLQKKQMDDGIGSNGKRFPEKLKTAIIDSRRSYQTQVFY